MSFLTQDFEFNKNNTKGKIIAFGFRLANLSCKSKFYKIILTPYRIFYKFCFDWILGFEVPYNTVIKKGFKVYHHQSIVINKRTKIGENFILRQSVTIGNTKSGSNCPVIGNNVELGANVIIIGDINIGNNVVIGAGSVVVKDIPDNSVVVGNPARVIKSL
ncbi:putative colanic acid biosynthesis acetyltransferase wcaB [Neptunitalea chrysea]|uniref:Colanic acid biosynthesis acetyltransferase wcaB n=1 Tax=Neptunitalea chrysea TaxID=1647581 RepID=A0A9W6B2Z8_9FLAO|nr:serine acetyltransferase [Neptunitalea chrysea]GLB51556.1 putative colanic acid biosynthesis acetyltransferase wcaB [Neptunitalea chrysea]